MQIILTQAEIEKAIQDYVLSQVSIRADQNIEIELKATRGETGFQAFISVTNQTAQVPMQIAARAIANEVQQPQPVTESVTEISRGVTKNPLIQRAVVTTADLKQHLAADTTEEAPVEAATPVSEAPAATVPVADETPSAPAPRRLFAGLVKPSNSAA